MSPLVWFLIWLAGALFTAFGLGCLKRQETLAHSLFWPIYLSGVALVAILVTATRMGRALRS